MNEWTRTVNKLKRELPTDLPVKVRIVASVPGGYRALCERKQDHYLIRIEKSVPLEWRYWLLAHEWGHLLDDWQAARDDHDASFGYWYSKAWNVIFKE